MVTPVPAADDERRPGAVLAVYSWDMLLALLALLGALAAFGGQATVGNRTVGVSALEQVLAGVSAAAYAAVLIILATLLTRRQRWVRRAQMTTFATAIVLGAISLLVVAFVPGQGIDTGRMLTAALLLVIDAIVLVVLTGPRIVAWYDGPGPIPRYIAGTLGFWAASSAVLVVIQALR